MLVNLAGVLFLRQLEAQVLLGTLVVGLAMMVLIYQRCGFIRLLGLGHVPWLIVLPWVGLRLDSVPAEPAFYKYWLIVLLITNATSLVLDTVDVWRFLRGDRHPYYHFRAKAGGSRGG
jgi:hypothetical protein